MNNQESIEEFSYRLDMERAKAFTLCIHDNIHVLQEACRGIPLHLLGALDQSCTDLADLVLATMRSAHFWNKNPVIRAAHNIACAARDVALAAPDVALAVHDVKLDNPLAVPGVAPHCRPRRPIALDDSDNDSLADLDDDLPVSHDVLPDSPLAVARAALGTPCRRPPHPPIACATPAASIAARAATLAVALSWRDGSDATIIDVGGTLHKARHVLGAAGEAARAAHATLADFYPDARIQYSAVLKNTEVIQLPHRLVFPVLSNRQTHISHQSGGSKVVLGGHADPDNDYLWVPVSVLDFGRLSTPR